MTSRAAATTRAVEVQGHRGARGVLAENSLPGFRHALALGVDTLELDVALTRDGVVVVHHDACLNPETTRLDGSWIDADAAPAIHALTLAELARYDVGAIRPGSEYARRFPEQRPLDGVQIPTLAEVIELLAEHGDPAVRLNVEVKSEPGDDGLTAAPETFARAVIRDLRAGDTVPRAAVQSFDWRVLEHVQRLAPEIATGYLSSQGAHWDTIGGADPSPWTGRHQVTAHGGSVPRMVCAAGGSAWLPDYRDLTPRRLAEARELGLRVVVWTVNAKDDLRRMIRMGVDGVISDYPDRALAVARELGRR